MKAYLNILFSVLSVLLALEVLHAKEKHSYALQNGDIVFQSGVGQQAKAVIAATDSEWTHVGVVFQEQGQWWVLEAVQPVKVTKLNDFIKRHPSSFHARRLKDTTPITAEALVRAKSWAKNQLRKPYDFKFLWDDDKLYCSELVWKLYKHAADVELCEPRPTESYNLQDPAVASLVKRRFGSIENLPKDTPTVAPSDLAESPLLVEVPRKK